MKSLLTFCLFLFAYGMFAQVTTSHQQEVQQTVIKLFDALSDRDAAALRAQCTADARFNEYGQAWIIDTLIHKAITKNTEKNFNRTNNLNFLSTIVKGDVAWTTYNLHSSITANGKNFEIYWMETVIAVREKKKWKIQVLHSTRVDKK